MNGKYAAFDVACYIVNKCIDDNKPIANLQLQKILYICQRDYVHQTKEFLIDDEFEAWTFGPVVPNVYRCFSNWGGMLIMDKVNCDNKLDAHTIKIIDPIIESRRELFPFDLVADVQADGKGYDKTYRNGKGARSIISKDLIAQD